MHISMSAKGCHYIDTERWLQLKQSNEKLYSLI